MKDIHQDFKDVAWGETKLGHFTRGLMYCLVIPFASDIIAGVAIDLFEISFEDYASKKSFLDTSSFLIFLALVYPFGIVCTNSAQNYRKKLEEKEEKNADFIANNFD